MLEKRKIEKDLDESLSKSPSRFRNTENTPFEDHFSSISEKQGDLSIAEGLSFHIIDELGDIKEKNA